jgi:hypothetical protein
MWPQSRITHLQTFKNYQETRQVGSTPSPQLTCRPQWESGAGDLECRGSGFGYSPWAGVSCVTCRLPFRTGRPQQGQVLLGLEQLPQPGPSTALPCISHSTRPRKPPVPRVLAISWGVTTAGQVSEGQS